MTPEAAALESPGTNRELAWLGELQQALGEVVVGQRGLVRGLLIGLLTGGHVLLEGVPGLAKSLAVASLARGFEASFARIQFTPDLLPSDLLGTEVFQPKDGTFSVRRGPIFAHFVLADEVNRAPAKVQSALLEAMQERQVSIGGQSYALPQPFLVLATQNPVDQEGTYALPEAQLDRFALKLLLDYPERAEELLILDRMATTQPVPQMRRVARTADILEARRRVDQVGLESRLREYIVALVHATRRPRAAGCAELEPLIRSGASPRATIILALASRAEALLEGRDHVIPSDIKRIAPAVLRHRVAPTYEAEAKGLAADQLIARILEVVPVP
jgi:MoxR-like ATPase